MKAVRRVLHASDFSAASGEALRAAIALCRQTGATLAIAHVISPPSTLMGEVYISPRVIAEMEESLHKTAIRGLERLAARAARVGVSVETRMGEGEISREILRLARAFRADLLVIGTHGRSGLERMFTGSVAGRLVQTSALPVMVVRGRPRAGKKSRAV